MNWTDNDGLEAVRKIYGEYLANRYADRPGEQTRRLFRFDTGHPDPSDQAAIDAGYKVWSENLGSGQALSAVRDAIYGKSVEQELAAKLIDPNNKDPAYRGRMQKQLAQIIEEMKPQWQQQPDTADLRAAARRALEDHLKAPHQEVTPPITKKRPPIER